MLRDKHNKFKEGYYHCSAFWECRENCHGVAKEKWYSFDCEIYINDKPVKVKSEPVTYFEHLMRKKIYDKRRIS